MSDAVPSFSAGPLPVIVDCDPGIDDALALALLAASPEFDIRAVTTVCGNVPVELATENAIRALGAFGRPEVPVAPGAGRPLVRSNPAYPPIHGRNGFGGVELPAITPARPAEPAIAALERVLEGAAPGEVTVIALAPLTNIALLLALRPDLADRIGLLAVMGATIDRGNVTPFAEFNTWADPEAAYRVLAANEVPTRLFTLAATRKAALDESQRLELARWSPVGATIAEMILGYDDQVTGAGWPLHDALVVAGLLEPEIVTLRPAAAIEVDTGTGPRRGAIAVTWDGATWDEASHPLAIAVDADSEQFRGLLRERISPLAGSQPA